MRFVYAYYDKVDMTSPTKDGASSFFGPGESFV